MPINKSEISRDKAEKVLVPPQSTAASASNRLRLSLGPHRPRDRFEVYRQNFSQYLYRAEVENRFEGTFDGGIEILKAGNVGVSRLTAPPCSYARTRRHVSDSDDALTLFVGRSKGLAIEQGDVSHEFHPGTGFLYHGALPGGAQAIAPMDLWGIKVPAGRIMRSMAPGRRLKPMPIAAELPAMKLITHYLGSFADVAGSADAELPDAFGTHLADLVMLIVGADRDTLELIQGRGLKAARTQAVLKAIGRDFSSPHLTADWIGRSLGITGRQVHRLLEETSKTFCEHVLERRLVEAYRLLADPACATLKAGEIALRAGFVDRSYFHRVFRIRFGATPMDVRAAAARENAGRFI